MTPLLFILGVGAGFALGLVLLVIVMVRIGKFNLHGR